MEIKVGGFFTVERFSRGGILLERREFHNYITNAGLNSVLTGAYPFWLTYTTFDRCSLGTGITAPAAGDVALATPTGNKISQTAGGSSTFDIANRKLTTVAKFQFNEGDASGNLTEVGIWRDGGATLWSRELFRDGGGNPVVITKTADDILVVTYTLTVQLPTGYTEATIDLGGTPTVCRGAILHNVLDESGPNAPDTLKTALGWSTGGGRVWELGSDNVTPPDVTQQGVQTLLLRKNSDGWGANKGGWLAYTNGTFYRDQTFVIDVTDYNGPVAEIASGGSAGYNCTRPAVRWTFNPVLPKTGSNKITFTYRWSLARG